MAPGRSALDVAVDGRSVNGIGMDVADRPWQIFQFLCQHLTVHTSGYVVSIARDDYRTTSETSTRTT